MAIEKVPVYCYQCVAGPDLLKVVVKDGVAVGVEPNSEMADVHPAGGKVCVRAYGLVQKLYNPARIKTPMRRHQPRQGAGPGSTLGAHHLGRGARDARGQAQRHPRRRARGRGGLPASRRDVRLGRHRRRHISGPSPRSSPPGARSIRGSAAGRASSAITPSACTASSGIAPSPSPPTCRARSTCCPSATTAMPRAASPACSGTPRPGARGLRWVQLEPHLSVTAAGAAEWVPIRPKTDAAVLFAMLHVLLWEQDWRATCDVPFLERMTSSPYLVGPGGYFLRDPATAKPVIWDQGKGRPVPFDSFDCLAPALDGEYIASGRRDRTGRRAPDGERAREARVRPSEGACPVLYAGVGRGDLRCPRRDDSPAGV